MPWDIYGNRLERGNCEVHPWVHEEYPCGVCMQESEQRQREKDEESRYWREQEAMMLIESTQGIDGEGI